MTNLKKYRRSVFILICLISLSTLLLGCNNQNKQHNKFGFIDKNDITSFKVHNIIAEEKEIKSKSDRDKIIDLINNLNITKSNVEPVIGMGFGVIIAYSNGEKFSASFMGPTMIYSTDDNGTWCKIDRNLDDILRSTYNETKVEGIDNAERKINEIVPIKYNDITKIIFTGNVNKTVENKESIIEIMNLIDGYVIKQEPQEFPVNGFNVSSQFFIGNKEVMNINFVNPIRINGKSYEYTNKQLGAITINDFLNSISLQ